MNNMDLFNEKPKKKDNIEKEDVLRVAKNGASAIAKVVTPVRMTTETREGRATEFLNSIIENNEYTEPLELLDQAFDLEELLLIQSCLSIVGQSILHSKLDGLNSYKERELNFEARQKMKSLAPNIIQELLTVIRKLKNTPEHYSSKDLYEDVCLVVSYRYMRYYVDCSDNTRVEFKAMKVGKFSVENNNGSAKVNANLSFTIPKFFEYICKLNEKTRNYTPTKL